MADRRTDLQRRDHPQSWGEANRRDPDVASGASSVAAPLIPTVTGKTKL